MERLDEDFMGYYYSKDSSELKKAVESTPESALWDVIWQGCTDKDID